MLPEIIIRSPSSKELIPGVEKCGLVSAVFEQIHIKDLWGSFSDGKKIDDGEIIKRCNFNESGESLMSLILKLGPHTFLGLVSGRKLLPAYTTFFVYSPRALHRSHEGKKNLR